MMKVRILLMISPLFVFTTLIGHAEDIYTYRNMGKAYFEEDRIDEAIAQFQQCVRLAPDSVVDVINLAIAYLGNNRFEDAAAALDKAAALDSSFPQLYYNRALIYKRQTQFDKAAEQFEKVKTIDPTCGDTRYNLGLTYLRLRNPEKAAEEFAKCVELVPDHVSAHYHLYRHALRTKQKEVAKKTFETFLRLKKIIPESHRTDLALERSLYSEIIVPQQEPSADEIEASTDANLVPVKFTNVTEDAGLVSKTHPPKETRSVFPASQYTQAFVKTHIVQELAGAAAFLDFDNDSDLDLYVVNGSTVEQDSANQLYRNNGDGTFTDVTASAGVGDRGLGLNCVIGDYDNDANLDIYVANYGPNVLYHNNGDGTFTDVTAQAGVGHPGFSMDAIFVDYDHEGDVDIYVANYVGLDQTPETPPSGRISFPADFAGQPNVLYRNNGDGTFTDVAATAGVSGGTKQSVRVLFSDFDDDNDTDLCVANNDGQSQLFLNLRDGKFQEAAEAWGIQPDFRPLVAGDINNDGRIDLGLDMSGMTSIAINSDNIHFVGFRPFTKTSAENADSFSPYFIDYNNDGRLDLLAVGSQYGLFRNDTDSQWTDVFAEVCGKLNFSPYRRAAFGDYDSDGDSDILLVGAKGRLALLRNDGGNANHWIKVTATGVKMNRAGLGSKVEARAGTFYFKSEVYTPHILIGLGGHNRLDAVRIKWPNGIAQNEIDVRANQPITIAEKKGIPSSCPFVYAWDGEKYCYVKDILDVGALGVRLSQNDFLPPDPDEIIKIDTVKLMPKDGVYSIRMTEELQEMVYLDGVKLYVVDGPSEVSVYHNDKFKLPPFPEFVFHAVEKKVYPVAAHDHNQNDVLSLITIRDRKYPKAFQLLPYTGITEPHSITLDFDGLSRADKVILFLNGWINWGDSTTNVALAQNPEVNAILPYLQVKNKAGRWQTVIDPMGFPAGWGKTVAIDLTDKFLSADSQVRIVTNMEIYWDEIFVGTAFQPEESLTITPLLADSASLGFYGYATPYSPDGEGPLLYDYEKTRLDSPWHQHAGRFTRYGDVTELLVDADDKYVIINHGEEVALEFNAKKLPPLPEGWVRDYFLYANGWIKDGDLNTAFGATVEPLPFHGMSAYPYTDQETYPLDSDHAEYLKTYNTREKN